MTDILNIFSLSSFITSTVCILIALVYMFISLRKKYENESEQLLKLIRVAAAISILSPIFWCLLSDAEMLYQTMGYASALYAVFAGAWLVLIVLGVLIFLFELAVRKGEQSTNGARKRFYTCAVFAFVCASALAWLFA